MNEMSEKTYRDTSWYCTDRDCGEVLGTVIGRELMLNGNIKAITDGPNLIVTCPKCGRNKVYYNSDPLVRAVFQLIDALVSAFASRAVKQMYRGTMQKEE